MIKKSEPQLSQSVQGTSVPRKFSKTDLRYWKPRLFKRTNDEWNIQIAFGGKRDRFPLKTANQDEASAKARDIYVSLLKEGWEATQAKFKPWTVKNEIPPAATVGEFLRQVEAASDLKAITFGIYARKFRRLVAGIAAIALDKTRFDYANGGASRWRGAVDAVGLAELTPTRIQSWKIDFLSKAADNPLKHRQAKNTAASILRSSKALFTKDVLKHVTVPLPTPLPFTDISIERAPQRYRSQVNPALLAQSAQRELEKEYPDHYKIFILALGAGMRRDEIDTLSWKQFDWSRGTIRIETNAYTSAKNERSEDEIDIAPEVVQFFKTHLQHSQSEFVINSEVKPRPGARYHHYRCNRIFRELVDWLRRKGVETNNPLHTLRKEYGSLICQQAGIFAASAALRHSGIQITRDTYVDKKGRVELPYGELLKKSAAEQLELLKSEP